MHISDATSALLLVLLRFLLPFPLSAGLVTHDDMQIMLRQLAGSSLSDDDIAWLVRKALQEADCPQGLSLEAFKATLQSQDLAGMTVQVPTEL
jgi:serine/threonine-protein phosphatase 2B regulatory subunit